MPAFICTRCKSFVGRCLGPIFDTINIDLYRVQWMASALLYEIATLHLAAVRENFSEV